MDNVRQRNLYLKTAKRLKSEVGYPDTLTDYTLAWTNVTAGRPGKRKKPAILLPQFGTASAFEKNVYASTQLGYACSSRIREERDFASLEQPFASVPLVLRSEDVSEMQMRLNNKVIEAIMEVKSQLGVDLLELGKTKTMVANALIDLRQGWKDLRRGQPLRSFVRGLNKTGWSGAAGNRFLEFTYGWAPTVKGAFETSDVLGQEFLAGKIYLGKVLSKMSRPVNRSSYGGYCWLSGTAVTRGKAVYQFSIKNPKLVTLQRLGLTNPAAIVWELTPWSFVFDWAFGFGDYLEKLDWDLGLTNVWQQQSVRQKAIVKIDRPKNHPQGLTWIRPCEAILYPVRSQRYAPTPRIVPSWKGIRNPYASKNADTRLAVSLALLNQQRSKIKSYM